MAVHTQVPLAALRNFLDRYDVGSLIDATAILEGVENSNYRVATTQGRYILTLYERRVDPVDLPYFMALLDHLADRGMPVAPGVADRDGRVIQQLAGRPACLIRHLPGRSLDTPTEDQAFAAGLALAQLHRAGADFAPRRANTMGVATCPRLLADCGAALATIAPELPQSLAATISTVTAAWPSDLPAATIHADLFPDNVMMEDGRVTGLIDFYFACTDLLAYDLAVMHSAWSFDASGEPRWRVGRALIDGYEAVRSLTPAERAGFVTLAIGACVRFTLSRAWDWLNTPDGSVVTRKDPMAYFRRIAAYHAQADQLA